MAQPKTFKSASSAGRPQNLRKPAANESDQVLNDAMMESVLQESAPNIEVDPEVLAQQEEAAAQEEAAVGSQIQAAIAPEKKQLEADARRATLEAYLSGAKGLAGAVGGASVGAGAARLTNLTRLGNVVPPGVAGAAAALGAGILTQVNADSAFRALLGMDQLESDQAKDKVVRDAIVDEVVGLGVGAAATKLLRLGANAVSGIANGAEINKLRALSTVEQVLQKFESSFGSKISEKEAKGRFSGLLQAEREQAGAAIGNIKNAASLIENQLGQPSQIRTGLSKLKEVLQNEGVVFKDDELIGIAEGRAFAPFSLPGSRGKNALNALINEYNSVYRSVKQRNGVPVSEIDKVGTGFENSADAEAALPGDSTYLQKVYRDLSSAFNQDRDAAYDRLLVGTPYEKAWKQKIWQPNQEKLSILKDAQNAFANENITRMVVENRPDLINKMVSVFGRDSDVVTSMKDVFVKRLMEKEPGMEVINPVKLLQKIQSSGEMLKELFSPDDIIAMKRFAIQAKRLNSARFSASMGADQFADDLITLTSKIKNPKAAAAMMFDVASNNAGVYRKINQRLLEKARNLPPRDADYFNDLAESLQDFTSFSNAVTTPGGVVKLIPGPLLKRLLLRETPSYFYKKNKAEKKEVEAGIVPGAPRSPMPSEEVPVRDQGLSESDI